MGAATATDARTDGFEIRRRPARGDEAGRRRPSTYTREEVLDAVRRWVELYGQPPTLADWDPSRARRLGHQWRAVRFEQGRWPTARMVGGQFARFGDAVVEAGFARPRGGGNKAQLLDADAEILRAIRAWAMRYGEPPVQADWDPARARQLGQTWRVARYEEGDWPSLASVRRHFGSLSAAVGQVDLEPGQANQSAVARLARRARNRRVLAQTAATEQRAHGPDQVAAPLRAVARARATGDDQALAEALVKLAGAALGWADALNGPRAAGHGRRRRLGAPPSGPVQ